MLGWFVLWAALSAAIVALMVTRQTKIHELLVLGGWGIITGMLGLQVIINNVSGVFTRIF